MARIDTWVKRFRSIGQKKTHERVLTRTSKFEVLTSTQAVRFRKLKQVGANAVKRAGSEPQVKPHYPLPEACRQLSVSVNRVLQAAAAGRLTCYVVAAGLRGSYDNGGEVGAGQDASETTEYLALTPADCQTIETWGSVNAHELVCPPDSGQPGAPSRFKLLEPLWVDSDRIVLRHPLPGFLAD